MHHIQFCLEELLAEIDAALEKSGFVRALAQLDQREAEHDPVTAIDGAELREHINRRIESLPLKQARNRLIQAQDLVEVAFGLKDPMPVRSNVIVLAAEGGVSNREASAKSAISISAAPVVRPAPQFKTMQERLAAAVGGGNQRRPQPRRA